MSGEETLLRVIGRVRGRMRLQSAVDLSARGALVGASLFAALAGAYRATGDAWWLAAGASALVLASAAGAALGGSRRGSMVAAALAADERLGLKERLATMVEAPLRGLSGPVVDAQRRDACAAAAGRDFSAVRPVRMPALARYVAVVLVVAFGIAAMPLDGAGGPSDGGALGRAIASAAGGVSEEARKVPLSELDDADEVLVREILEKASEMAAAPTVADPERARSQMDEWIERIDRQRRDSARLESLKRALADARSKLAEAGEAEPDTGSVAGRSGPERPDEAPAPAAGDGGALASAEALADASRRYPEYADVLRRYFSAGRAATE